MSETILSAAAEATASVAASATESFISEPTYVHLLKTASPYVHSLRGLIWDPNYLPFSIIATLHAIRVALNYRYQFSKTYDRPQVPWLKGLITHLLMSLGGGITSTIIFGRHISWLASNTTVPLYSIVYFLVLYSPYDIVFRFLMLVLPIIKPLLVISDATNSGFGISTNLDVIRYGSPEPLKSSYVAMIICGTIGSCGGGILTDLFSLNQHNWALKTPNFVSKVPPTIKGPFFLSIFYLISTTEDLHPNLEWIRYVIPLLDRDQAQAIVTTAFISLHLTLEYVYGPLFKFENVKEKVEVSEKEAKKGEESKKKK